MKCSLIAVVMLCLFLPASAQTLPSSAAPPQYKDPKVLVHLQDLETQIKTLRYSELKVSFNGWSNADVSAAARKHTGETVSFMGAIVSKIDDVRASGGYSARQLFDIYSAASSIQSGAADLGNLVAQYKHDGQLGAEIIGNGDYLLFSVSDLNRDISSLLDLQGDTLTTLLSQSPCSESK